MQGEEEAEEGGQHHHEVHVDRAAVPVEGLLQDAPNDVDREEPQPKVDPREEHYEISNDLNRCWSDINN